ncbi:MAG: long-chain fatty acid--CoA ligase, partial [Gammaproteobacteria bacterium]|nr:long-chain fatty acid--CoA ligase [Gammaproteobacteria bacterium]
GLVSVPLYPNDRPDNVSYIINDADIKVLMFRDQTQWDAVSTAIPDMAQAPAFISCLPIDDQRITHQDDWVNQAANDDAAPVSVSIMDLATIVYTSGTTGRPKGVMLSHNNILKDAWLGIASVDVYKEDLFLSFLPLSHTLERTVGYYIPMMCGSSVAYCRSIPELAEDLQNIKPTVLISVPRIFERVYGKVKTGLAEKPPIAKKLFDMAVAIGYERFLVKQGRGSSSLRHLLWPLLNKLVASKILEKLGGRVRFAISGGAPLPKEIGETFIGLGLQILQGYGLTETSPVISVNKIKQNIPNSIGLPLEEIQVRVSDIGELQTRSECVMMGYWNNEKATKETFTEDGWLKTGDLAKIDEQGYIYITGRLKEVMVLSNGEKIAPVDVEMAITLDPLIEQAMVIGEAKPYLAAIIVLNPEAWPDFAKNLGISSEQDSLRDPVVIEAVKEIIARQMASFPGYAQVHQISLSLEVWTDQNHLLTASLKMNRKVISDRFEAEIAQMYSGH